MRFRISAVFREKQLDVRLKVLFLSFELYGNKKENLNKSDFKIRKFRRRRDKVLKKYKVKSTPLGELKKKIINGIKKLRGSGEGGKKKTSPIVMIKDLKAMLWDTVCLFGKKHKIDRFDIKINVGGKDASSVAINYGYVITSLQYLVTFLELHTNLDKTKRKSAEVIADFTTEKWDADINVSLSLRTIDIIRLALSAFKGFLKHKIRKRPQKADNNEKDGK